MVDLLLFIGGLLLVFSTVLSYIRIKPAYRMGQIPYIVMLTVGVSVSFFFSDMAKSFVLLNLL